MKIAIPMFNGQITAHFGHCENFAIVETKDNQVIGEEIVAPPVHVPGAYPKFLAEKNVQVIIAGGMGVKAQQLFTQNNIVVHMGVTSGTAKELVQNYLNDQLKTGDNLCDH
ncbi:MAG: NifB/NifX family molybdenum-iron cluster-binding protein [Bacteroidota bacterium]